MQFKKYNSIDNSYREKTVRYIKQGGFDKVPWVAQEKIHGCNMSFIIDDDGKISCAKRSGFIKEGENFFNYELVKEKYQQSFNDFYKDKGGGWIFYGELYGGGYDHPDVKNENVKRIQKGG